MFTQKELDAVRDLAKKEARTEAAALLRQEAQASPKWEVHDLLQKLAEQIEGVKP